MPCGSEVRACARKAALWQHQGKEGDAGELLNDVYTWFTEGLDTVDLRDARDLLNELGAMKAVEISGSQAAE